MKKIFTFILASFAIIACSKNEQPIEYGSVELKAVQGSTVFVETKASTEISDDYKVTITNTTSGSTVKSDTYGNLKGIFTLPAASYKVEAESCSVADAETANTNWGKARYAGSKTFDITAGSSQNVAFECSMANSKVTVAYDPTFTSQFSTYSVETYTVEARKVTFDGSSTHQTPAAYFAPATLNVVITGTNLVGAAKKYTETITLAAKTWHKLTIKATTTQGSVDLSITVDDTILEITNDITVDPYEEKE